jgi:flagellar biosynthesis chaperone FliJ
MLAAARAEIEVLNGKRLEYEENMKKAFMRGMSAHSSEHAECAQACVPSTWRP